MDCLLFQLYGPLASWGDIAVGERRRTTTHPSRSAVLGLVAAALGVRRDESERLEAITSGYGFACRVAGSARLLVDYHTTQVSPALLFKKRPPENRKDALERNPLKVETILSQREYLTGSYAVGCLWAHVDAPHALEDLAAALQQPVFTLYLGRKACPLALPLAPTQVRAVDPIAALAGHRFPDEDRLNPKQSRKNERVFWEGDFPGRQPLQTRRRRDVAGNRMTWLFTERLEHSAPLESRDVSESD